MIQTLSWQRKEKLYSARALFSGQLPTTIRGGEIDPDRQVTVFAQHAPGPAYLAGKLKHLQRNNYETVSAAEYLEWQSGRKTLVRPSVMLTFDDGWRKFRETTYPALKQYKMKSVLFVCPGLVDLASDQRSPLSTLARKTLLTWDELREIHEEGLVDIQSHGMWHNCTPISSKVMGSTTDFASSLWEYSDLLPPDERIQRLIDGSAKEQPVSRLDSRPFFQWHGRDREAQVKAFDHYLADLKESRQAIEHHLPGKEVIAFAFPWWNGTRLATQAARMAGYQLVFRGMMGLWGKQTKESLDPLRIGRLGFDWMHCLNGLGRIGIGRMIYELAAGKRSDDTA